MLSLDLQVAARGRVPGRAQFRRWARAALAGNRRRRVALTVRVVEAPESARLNRRYRDKPGATNVLSFGFDPPPGVNSDLLGDLVICAPLVRREAGAQDKRESAHWAHLVVHGILHLRGYDHDREREATVMERRETRILRALGYPDPYR
ncbi:MAG: rRNA maturation RNase YbeY [Pseudomonadota bacterium]